MLKGIFKFSSSSAQILILVFHKIILFITAGIRNSEYVDKLIFLQQL